MNKKKLNLKEVKVKSFNPATNAQARIKGGAFTFYCEPTADPALCSLPFCTFGTNCCVSGTRCDESVCICD